MRAVARNGHALQHATAELRGDREVVMKAVTRNGCAVHYASEAAKGQRESNIHQIVVSEPVFGKRLQRSTFQ